MFDEVLVRGQSRIGYRELTVGVKGGTGRREMLFNGSVQMVHPFGFRTAGCQRSDHCRNLDRLVLHRNARDTLDFRGDGVPIKFLGTEQLIDLAIMRIGSCGIAAAAPKRNWAPRIEAWMGRGAIGRDYFAASQG